MCPTCENQPNPANFGGLCDACEAKRQERTDQARLVLRAHDQQDSDFGRAIGA